MYSSFYGLTPLMNENWKLCRSAFHVWRETTRYRYPFDDLVFWSWMSFAGNDDDPRCLEVVVLRWGSPGDSRRFITSLLLLSQRPLTGSRPSTAGDFFCPSKIQMRKKGLRTAFIRARVGELDAVTPLSQTVTRLLQRQVFVWAKKKEGGSCTKRAEVRLGELFFFHFHLNRCWRSSQYWSMEHTASLLHLFIIKVNLFEFNS